MANNKKKFNKCILRNFTQVPTIFFRTLKLITAERYMYGKSTFFLLTGILVPLVATCWKAESPILFHFVIYIIMYENFLFYFYILRREERKSDETKTRRKK